MWFAPQRACTFATSQLPKVVQSWCALYILTWKCASRHNSVHFFDISTSKSGPELVCFVHFWLGNALRATTACTFRHLNFQKWSRAGVLCAFLTWKCASRHNSVHFFDISTSKSGPELVCFVHFWLGNALRATTACTFRHLNFQKWSRAGVLCAFLTWKRASRHNSVHFFEISTSKSGPELVCFVHFDLEMCFAPQRRAIFIWIHLASWLRTRRFSEPTFRPSGATNHWKKHTVLRLSYLFAHLHLLSSDSFSSLIFSLLLFSSLTLPTSAFPSVHIVGSLTWKLPSISGWNDKLLLLAIIICRGRGGLT